MNKRWWLILIILCSAAVVFTISGVLQNRGHNSAFAPDKPGRIVSLAPNLTEILFALGLGEKIVAVSNDSDCPSEAGNKNKVGTFWQPNTEAIIASKPDFVVTESFEQQKTAGESLEKLGYNVLSLKIETIEELFAAIQKIGAVTDCRQSAEKIIRDISNKLNNLRAKFSSSNRVKVLWVMQAEPLRVVGRSTFINEIIELAGGENAIGPTIQKYPPIGTEELMACGAEVIIQSAMIKANIADEQKTAEAFWSRWTGLPAVKNNRIYVVESDTILRLGPRLPQGVETIGHYLHPDVLEQGNGTIKQIR